MEAGNGSSHDINSSMGLLLWRTSVLWKLRVLIMKYNVHYVGIIITNKEISITYSNFTKCICD